jgi:hypothetical protein
MTRSAVFARVRSERGQVAIEMLGTTGMLLLAALVAWQLALAGWSAVGAANAARTAARAYSRTGDEASAEALGKRSLQDDFLGAGSSVQIHQLQDPDGNSYGRADVVVDIPIIVPGLNSPIPVSASASMPTTG